MSEIYDLIKNFPENAEKALETEIEVPESHKKFDKIVFAGVGGSGISGNIAKDWLSDCPVPVIVVKNYNLPVCVDRDSLLFCVSYSGDTQETLSCLDEAIKRGCKIIGVSSGGELRDICERNKITYLKLEAGLPARTALPFMFFSIASVLSGIGIKKRKDLVNAVKIMKRYRSEIEGAAKSIVLEIENTFPFIYGNFESACLRFKTQLNENSKIHSKYELFSELNHNEIVGWQGVPTGKSSVIILNDNSKDVRFKNSVGFLRQILKEKATMVEIFPKGKYPLEKIFYFIYLGDFISYYLARELNKDPYDIGNIDRLKRTLKVR